MSTSIADERRLLSEDEYAPVVRSHHPALKELTRDELVDLVRWLRDQRSKFRGQVERRRRARRGKAEPRVAAAGESSERGVAAKKQVFARALKRVNARLDMVLANEKRATMHDQMTKALERKRRAPVHHPASGRRGSKGAQPIENPKGADIVPGSAVGSISQATRVAQARRDNRD